ncbi:MAG: hypothetical protein UBAL2_80490315, partial [Leptospirillum rubarum]
MELIHPIDEQPGFRVTRSGSGAAPEKPCEGGETLHTKKETPEAFRLILKRVR